MKKSILSLILIFAILSSVFAISTVSVSAASSPQLNLVRGSKCFNVVWNKVSGAVNYRLYFGAVSPNGNGWRRFTVLTQGEISTHPTYTGSWQFLINSNSLRNRKWYAYGDDKNISTPSLKTTECYQCQIEALGAGDKHITWTNVSYVYLGVPQVEKYPPLQAIIVTNPKYSEGSVNYKYQIAYKAPNSASYTYRDIKINLKISNVSGKGIFIYDLTKFNYQVRTIVEKNGKVLAYGPWTKSDFASF